MPHTLPPPVRESRRRWPTVALILGVGLVPLLIAPLPLLVTIGMLTPWVLLLLAVRHSHRTRVVLARATRRVEQLRAELAVALTDPVTGLPVRRPAETHLDRATGLVSVAVVDVDDLRGVNNTHGHLVGDAYLAGIADRLSTLTATDPPGAGLVARLGGDEFVVITRRDPQDLAAALRALTWPRLCLGDRELPVRFSAGICQLPGGDAHTGFGRADLAMYTAKRGGGGVAVYDPDRDGSPHPPGVRPTHRTRDRGTDHGEVIR
ncbi:MAG: GGDEF domain-containing protein [Actinobacteria bacterium]|nr:GGDEF domain-containing protein [Actinomycetota bacterium]MBI3687401.1 GGDEF domain-containing protein [Actinomycetota bacterium]